MSGRAEFNVIGRRVESVGVLEKVMGTAKYTDDLKLPGMLYGKILRSPHAHAKILRIDTRRALEFPGVVAVITGKDVPHNPRILGSTINDQSVLTEDKVRYIGDSVAAVAALTQETAERALELIDIDYEPLPAVFSTEEAMKPGAPEVHDGAENNIASVRRVRFGDIEKGFQEADHIFEDTFRTQPQEHATIEPQVAIAMYEPGGNLTLWTASQTPFKERAILSRSLGIPQHKIRVIVPNVGGGFGGKDVQMRIIYVCAALARKVGAGRPVKIVHTREEDIVCDTIRHPTEIHLRTGVKRDGTITARECRLIMDNGAYTHHGDLGAGAIGVIFSGVYKTPNLKYDAHLVYTNLPYGGPMRGFGNPQITFAVESHMDRIARGLNMDPVELRLKNAVEEGDLTARGQRVGRCGLKECIVKASEAIGWAGKRNSKEKAGRRVRGVGIACGNHWCGWRSGFDANVWRTGYRKPEELYEEDPSSPFVRVKKDGSVDWRENFRLDLYDADPSSCVLIVNEDGSVTIHIGEVELGQGAKTIAAMIAAEELGIRAEDVKVIGTDTDSGAFGLGSYASRTTLVLGNAVKGAAAEAKSLLFRIAAEMLEAHVEDLEAREGRIYVRGSPGRNILLADAAFRAYATRGAGYIIFKGYHDPDSTIPDPVTGRGTIAPTWSYFAQAAEVEVDRTTGEVSVISIASAHDVGRLINPIGAEGQVEGAAAQGMGYALTEEMEWKQGRTMNPNLLNYHIVPAADMPKIECIFVETDDPEGPFGAKGMGEPASVPVAPAIANAIEDAIGRRIFDLPIRPEKVLEALRRKE